MLKFVQILLLPILFCSSLYAFNGAPKPIEITAAGSAQNPYFLPKMVELKQGELYQVTINNPFVKPYTFYLTDSDKAVLTHVVHGSSGISSQSIIIPSNSSIKWELTAQNPGLYAFYESSGMNREVLTEGILMVVPHNSNSSTSQPTNVTSKSKPQSSLEQDDALGSEAQAEQVDDDLIYIPYGPGPVKRFINKIKGKPNQYNY